MKAKLVLRAVAVCYLLLPVAVLAETSPPAALESASKSPLDLKAAPNVAPDWFVGGDQREAVLGFSVASAGDVNGDGFDDVIIGSPGYQSDEYREGLSAGVKRTALRSMVIPSALAHKPSSSHIGMRS